MLDCNGQSSDIWYADAVYHLLTVLLVRPKFQPVDVHIGNGLDQYGHVHVIMHHVHVHNDNKIKCSCLCIGVQSQYRALLHMVIPYVRKCTYLHQGIL